MRVAESHLAGPGRARAGADASPPAGCRRPARPSAAGAAAAATRITSSTRARELPPPSTGAPCRWPRRRASTRTSRAPPRSCSGARARPWLRTAGLPARLVTPAGAVETTGGWPASGCGGRMIATAGPSALWYLTRGTGLVTLAAAHRQRRARHRPGAALGTGGSPRFVVVSLHRAVSLLVVALLAVHVLTAVLDSFAPIRLVDAVLPFAGTYRPLWLGLGALAFDLILALTITSLLRHRLGLRRVARRALARLRLLAGRAGARLGHRLGYAHALDARAHARVRGGRARRRRMADRERPAGLRAASRGRCARGRRAQRRRRRVALAGAARRRLGDAARGRPLRCSGHGCPPGPAASPLVGAGRPARPFSSRGTAPGGHQRGRHGRRRPRPAADRRACPACCACGSRATRRRAAAC